jgi:hypothetical protein
MPRPALRLPAGSLSVPRAIHAVLDGEPAGIEAVLERLRRLGDVVRTRPTRALVANQLAKNARAYGWRRSGGFHPLWSRPGTESRRVSRRAATARLTRANRMRHSTRKETTMRRSS